MEHTFAWECCCNKLQLYFILVIRMIFPKCIFHNKKFILTTSLNTKNMKIKIQTCNQQQFLANKKYIT